MFEVIAEKRSEEVENEKLTVEGYAFFMPSIELTNAILEHNQRLVAAARERNLPAGYPSNQNVPQVEDGSLLGRIGSELLRAQGAPDPGRQTRMGQLLISERLYHYLFSLAETPLANEGGEFSIWEYIPSGMATMLGLLPYREMPDDARRIVEIRESLEQLTKEFRNWLLQEHGSFVTPWFAIDLSENDTLLFETVDSTPDRSNADYEQAYEPITIEINKDDSEVATEERMYEASST